MEPLRWKGELKSCQFFALESLPARGMNLCHAHKTKYSGTFLGDYLSAVLRRTPAIITGEFHIKKMTTTTTMLTRDLQQLYCALHQLASFTHMEADFQQGKKFFKLTKFNDTSHHSTEIVLAWINMAHKRTEKFKKTTLKTKSQPIIAYLTSMYYSITQNYWTLLHQFRYFSMLMTPFVFFLKLAFCLKKQWNALSWYN